MTSKKHLRNMISSLLEQNWSKAKDHLEEAVKVKIQDRYDGVYSKVCKTNPNFSLNK